MMVILFKWCSAYLSNDTGMVILCSMFGAVVVRYHLQLLVLVIDQHDLVALFEMDCHVHSQHERLRWPNLFYNYYMLQ